MFSLKTWMGNLDLTGIIKTNIDRLTQAKRKYTIPNIKSMCEDFIRENYNRFYKLYTDGSKDGVSTGAAFLDAELDVAMKFQINEQKICIMNCELIAICEALSYIKSIAHDKFVIFTDSRSSLQHLARCTSAIRGTPIAYCILERLVELKSNSKCVMLQWIPSHCNVGENDKVDKYAREACNEGIPYDVLPFYTDCISVLKNNSYDLWNEYFDQRSREKGIWYKTIQPHIPRAPWIDNITLSRTDMVTAFRLRSGHIPSNKFAYLMRKVSSPNCIDCGVPEDLYHILVECVRNEVFRRNICLHRIMVGEFNYILANPLSKRAKLVYKLYNICMQNRSR